MSYISLRIAWEEPDKVCIYTHCELFETKPALLDAAQNCFERFNQCSQTILSVIGSKAKNVS
jgi:hypothetical protein